MDIPVRFWIAVMIFCTTFTNHMLRSSFSISVLSMVNDTELSFVSKRCQNAAKTKPHPFQANHTDVIRLYWSEMTEGWILGSYLWSYILLSLVAGPIIAYFGPCSTIFYSSISAGLLNAFIPAGAVFSPWVVFFLRALMGALAASEYPAAFELISQWSPQEERGRFLAAMMSGSIGIIFAWITVAFITYYISWTWAFYALTIIELMFAISFAFITTDNPLEHKWVKADELSYILENQEEILEVTTHRKKRTIWPPYRKMFKSAPFWGITIAHSGYLWAVVLSITYMPKFLANPLGYDILQIGIICSLPLVAYFLFLILFGLVGDCCRANETISVMCTRRLAIIFSHFAPACCFLLMITIDCASHSKIVALLLFAHIFGAAVVIGHFQNIHDIAPHLVGAISGVIFFVSGLAGIEPVLHSLILSWIADSLQASRVIFAICGSVLVLSGVGFLALARADVQTWTNIQERDVNNERH